MQEVKNLVIPGIVGILLACAIFSAFIIAPWASTTSNVDFPQMPPGWPSSPLDVQVFVSNLTETLGVESEGEVTVVVTSTRNVSDTVLQFELLQVCRYPPMEMPIGIVYVEGNLANTTWTGDLTANVSVIFNARIKAIEVGYARIRVTAIWYPFEGFHYEATNSVWILIQETDIQISHEPITPPGVIPFEPGNGTLPTWP